MRRAVPDDPQVHFILDDYATHGTPGGCLPTHGSTSNSTPTGAT
ncbi:hypothetical protein [Streptomyces sp. AB3(2024)]